MAINTQDCKNAIKAMGYIMKDVKRKFGNGDKEGLATSLHEMGYAASQLADAVRYSDKIFR